MKVELLKDVLTPHNGVGRAGQVVEMSDAQGRQYISKELAKEAAADAEALPPDPKPGAAKPLTRDTLKEDKKGTARDTKPTGPSETK